MMHHNAELELAWNFVEKTDRNIFLTGKAGTGKTTFLHKIKNESLKRLVVVAPTGVAAINAKGVTIHSFFQMPFGPILPAEAEDPLQAPSKNKYGSSRFQRKFNKKKIDIIRSLDLLIIDEISMVRADLLDGIDQVLRRYKNKDKVFGGTQLLMIGDLQQLAPVVKNEEWTLLRPYYDTAFFFSSRAFQESNALGIELKHIYRQDNERFIGILNEIRNNVLSEASMEALNERFDDHFEPKADDGYITLTTHNARADAMNRKELNGIKRKSWYFTAEIDGDFPEYSYPTDERLELKIGAQVMFIKNDSSPEKRYFNGKIGKIVGIEKNEVTVRCPGDQYDIETERETWENVKYSVDDKSKEIKENVIGSFEQIPLRLAWAITIHKSQGLTFERAIIDAAASFAHGQTYVALSRCKTLEGIVLKSRIGGRAIIQDSRVVSFTQDVEEHQPNQQQLNTSQNHYQLNLIEEMFSLKQLPYLINRCNKVVYQAGNRLKGNVVEPMKVIKMKGIQELLQIGERFNRQLASLNNESEEEPENNDLIQTRIKKGVEYFTKHLTEFVVKPLSEIIFTTDNKSIEKDFQEPFEKIKELISQKMFVLQGMKDGFFTMRYLELRAKAVLQKANLPKAKEKTSAEKEVSPHPELFEQLRKLRREIAEEEDIAVYQVFTQASLFQFCEDLPTTEKQLRAIMGMGKVRVKKYGEAILKVVGDYCVENNLEQRKEEAEKMDTAKTTQHKKDKPKSPKKGETQQKSLAMLRAGKNIKEIAAARGLTISTIEGHLSQFIAKGELEIEEVMPTEKVQVLKKLIKSTKYEGLNDLKSQLGNKFSYGELKMLISDLARESS
jgi:hypothetical protein